MKALIPAAGMGTRFLPATKAIPKEMLPVIDRPVIQYVVEEAHSSGADEVVIINSRDKKAIEQHFARNLELEQTLRQRGKDAYAAAVEHAGSLPVSFVYQDEPLGLGHAVHCAAHKMDGQAFYVLLGDVIVPDNNILPRMKQVSEEHGGASVVAVLEVPEDQVSRFGVIAGGPLDGVEDVWRVTGLVEKPSLEVAPSHYSVFGRYLLSPRVMDLLADVKPGAGNEIQLTDALDAVLAEEEMFAVIIKPDDGFDTGTIETWLDTNNRLAAARG